MFQYFGFGSNISMVSLRAKGVNPSNSQPAVLKGWKLRFNVQHFFRNEGGVGNIEHTGNPEDRVIGILHECPDESLEPLDATEAYGYGYDRISIDVEVLDDVSGEPRLVEALTYVGMPGFIDNSCLPSRRYLNIILDGAKQADLDADYVAELEKQPVLIPAEYPNFEPPKGEFPTFDTNSLKEYPTYTALMGAVFDMADARPHHDFLKGYFGGKDMTLFHLKRLDSSDETESIDDIKQDNLNDAQRKYLNSFLNEYALEYRYVGQYKYHHE